MRSKAFVIHDPDDSGSDGSVHLRDLSDDAASGGDKHIVIGSNDADLALEVSDELAASKAAPIQADVIAPADKANKMR